MGVGVALTISYTPAYTTEWVQSYHITPSTATDFIVLYHTATPTKAEILCLGGERQQRVSWKYQRALETSIEARQQAQARLRASRAPTVPPNMQPRRVYAAKRRETKREPRQKR